jgi:hypothetical protein
MLRVFGSNEMRGIFVILQKGVLKISYKGTVGG